MCWCAQLMIQCETRLASVLWRFQIKSTLHNSLFTTEFFSNLKKNNSRVHARRLEERSISETTNSNQWDPRFPIGFLKLWKGKIAFLLKVEAKLICKDAFKKNEKPCSALPLFFINPLKQHSCGSGNFVFGPSFITNLWESVPPVGASFLPYKKWSCCNLPFPSQSSGDEMRIHVLVVFLQSLDQWLFFNTLLYIKPKDWKLQSQPVETPAGGGRWERGNGSLLSVSMFLPAAAMGSSSSSILKHPQLCDIPLNIWVLAPRHHPDGPSIAAPHFLGGQMLRRPLLRAPPSPGGSQGSIC